MSKQWHWNTYDDFKLGGYSDDFVTRLIRSSTSTIKDNIIYILRNSRSRVSMLYMNENRVKSFDFSRIW
jgi:hypothetical protein